MGVKDIDCWITECTWTEDSPETDSTDQDRDGIRLLHLLFEHTLKEVRAEYVRRGKELVSRNLNQDQFEAQLTIRRQLRHVLDYRP